MSEHDKAVRSIIELIVDSFNSETLRIIEAACYTGLREFDVITIERENTELTTDISPDVKAYQMYFVAKKVEGLSDKSLQLYRYTIDKFLKMCQKPLTAISANDIRFFIASRQGIALTTLDNERRYLSSFFTWLHDEEYIPKNPMKKIKAIKQGRVVRKPFTGKEIEELRDACNDKRERAIVEVLLSTGMRVGELHGVDRDDVSGSEVMVTGKGNKQRVCYLNPTALKRLNDYLAERTDILQPLILADLSNKGAAKYGHRLGIGRYEQIVREIGRRAGVDNTHPHKFRRTAATTALQRGMPIEQVQKMLGHEAIDTTLRYALTADETVKHAHSKYM